MARSPLTDTFQKVQGMVSYVQQNLSGDEYNLFLDMVAPQPEPEVVAKKTRKKRATKSAKAQSLSSAISQTSSNSIARLTHGDGDAATVAPKSNGQLCTAIIPGLGVECADPASASIHDPNGGYGGYHPFDTSAPAQPAEKKSRRKAAGANNTANSGTSSDAAISLGGD